MRSVSKALQVSGGVQVEITNADPWAGASASVVKLEVVSCSGGTVLSMMSSVPVSFAKGEKKAMTFAATVPPKAYLRVTADANGQVGERLETNNIFDGMGSCIR